MTNVLTLDLISEAQANDLAATSAVIAATEERLTKLAAKAARRMAPGGDRYSEYHDEFIQTARIAVWEQVIPRFEGETLDSFYAFLHTTVEGVLLDSVRKERNGATGADADAVKVFASMLTKADGDVFLAEKLSQTVPPKGRRLSADRAQAARMAWQGTTSTDAPAHPQAEGRVPSAEGSPLLSFAERNLSSTLGVPDELITADDITREQSRVKHAIVSSILDVMGATQRIVIKHSFGIGGFTFYGHGASGDDEGMAAETGMTVSQIRPARSKGLRAFAKRYVAAVAESAEHAAEMTQAAAVNLSPGGRK